MRVDSQSDEILGGQLQIDDIEMQDCSFHGAVSFTQVGAASAITRMENVHVAGRGRTVDFYYPQYGLEPNCVISNCTFENINGWALRGRFEDCLIEHNTFRDVCAVSLLAKVTDASNKSNHTVICNNTFVDCQVILSVWDGTTRAAHGNRFRDNTVTGINGIVYRGSSPGTSVYWRGNHAAKGTSWNTLATNCADTIHSDLTSDHE